MGGRGRRSGGAWRSFVSVLGAYSCGTFVPMLFRALREGERNIHLRVSRDVALRGAAGPCERPSFLCSTTVSRTRDFGSWTWQSLL